MSYRFCGAQSEDVHERRLGGDPEAVGQLLRGYGEECAGLGAQGHRFLPRASSAGRSELHFKGLLVGRGPFEGGLS